MADGTASPGTPDGGSPGRGTPDRGTPDDGTASPGTPDHGTASPGTPDGGSPDPAPRDQGGASWTLESWVDALSAALGIDPDVPVTTLLDSTREVAHQVARPAAPLTLYLVGYAVAQRGGGPDDIAVALDTVRDLIAAGPDGAA